MPKECFGSFDKRMAKKATVVYQTMIPQIKEAKFEIQGMMSQLNQILRTDDQKC